MSILNQLIALLSLLILSPLLLVVFLLQVGLNGFPIFFRQERIGAGGKPFKLFKFRTMVDGSHLMANVEHPLHEIYIQNGYKLPEEYGDLYTKTGLVFRKWSIDEIPQLLNVLKGDMNLVGPRPIVSGEVEMYGEHADEIFSVKPGVTGYWQISGRSQLKDEERVQAELYYVRNRSFWFDIKILLKTVPAVLSREGAY